MHSVSRMLSALNAVHDGMGRDRTLEEMAGIVAREFLEATACQCCAVFLIDDGNAHIMAEIGFQEDGERVVLYPERLMEHFLRNSAGIHINELSESSQAFFLSGGHGFNSLVCTPVEGSDVVRGFVLAGSHHRNAFDGEALMFSQLIARELSIAVRISSLEAKVSELSVRDELTGCLNRMKFDDDIEIEIPCAERYGRPLSILLVGVDRFRTYKEVLSQSNLDGILKQIGEILSYSVRTCDKLYYFGGDEFAIMLPGIDKERTAFAAQRILKVIERYEFDEELVISLDRHITVSIGMASFPADAVYKAGLIKCLESALFKARQSDGNTAA